MAKFTRAAFKQAFHSTMHSVVRAASTAAFRAKVLGRTLKEIRGIPLHQLTDQPMRRELVRQNAFAVEIYGRHLTTQQRQGLLQRINTKTLVVRSIRSNNAIRWGIPIATIGALSLYAAGGEPTTLLGVLGNSAIGTAIIRFIRDKRATADYGRVSGKSRIPQSGYATGIGAHEATHAMQWSKVVGMPKRAIATRHLQEVMAEATARLYYGARQYAPTELPSASEWSMERDPYRKGMILGVAIGNIPPGGTYRPWAILHAMSRGRITPEQAYEIAKRRAQHEFRKYNREEWAAQFKAQGSGI